MKTTEESGEASVSSVSSNPDEENETAVNNVKTISVYICGEVVRPGIYSAPSGVLLNDIIEDAGGLTLRHQ